MDDESIEFGQRVRDEISGFEGYVRSLGFHISECTTARVIAECESNTAGITKEEMNTDRLVMVDGSEKTDMMRSTDEAREFLGDIELGCGAIDEVSGFEGIVCLIQIDAYEVPNILLRAPSDDGEEPETTWVDAVHVMRTGDGIADVREEIEEMTEDTEGGSTAGMQTVADQMQ